MEKYKVIICLTYHESPECIADTVKNFQHYMPDSFIIINNGPGTDLTYLNSDHVHVLEKSFTIKYYQTMIPIHIVMTDYIKEKNIQSDYVLLMSSNQLFIKHNFYDFMKQYKAGYFKREHVCSSLQHTLSNEYLCIIGKDYFKYQSNHDGMFFLYDDFLKMIEFFEKYRGVIEHGHQEEFLYIAYLLRLYREDEMAEFSTYNCWTWEGKMNIDMIKNCMCKEMYIAKRILRDINDEGRKYIREMDPYS